MSNIQTNLVKPLAGLSSNTKYVLFRLADHANDDGTEARPGLDRLMQETCLKERVIRQAFSQLEAAKLMVAADHRYGGRKHVTNWTLTLANAQTKIDEWLKAEAKKREEKAKRKGALGAPFAPPNTAPNAPFKGRKAQPKPEPEIKPTDVLNTAPNAPFAADVETLHVVPETLHVVPETLHVVPEKGALNAPHSSIEASIEASEKHHAHAHARARRIASAWSTAQARLKTQCSPAEWSTWLVGLKVGSDPEALRLVCASNAQRDQVERRYRERIQAAMWQVLRSNIPIYFTTAPPAQSAAPPAARMLEVGT